MRRWFWLTTLLITESAMACDWVGPISPIEVNLDKSRFYADILMAAIVICFLLVRRTRKLWIPLTLAAFLLLDWYAMGTAYHGDCGGTSLMVNQFFAIVGGFATAWCGLWLYIAHKRRV